MDKTGTEAVANIVASLTRPGLSTDQQQADTNDESMLGQLLLQQAACQKLQQYLLQKLEFWPARAASVSHVQQHQLVIRCVDGGSASRVRFMQNDILQAVLAYANASSDAGERSLFHTVTRIRVSVDGRGRSSASATVR